MSDRSSSPEQTAQPGSIQDPVPGATEGKIPYPRVRKKPGIRPADTMAEAGRKILRFHFAHMISHESGTRLGEDIEELHDMRVATRRMRAAFDVCGDYLKPRAVRKPLKKLRAAGRTLGRVRDLDVFMESTQAYLGTLPEGERGGLDPLMDKWRQKRGLEREKMIAYLDSENYQRFKKEFNRFTASPEKTGGHPVETRPDPDLVKLAVPVIVYMRLGALRAYESLIPDASMSELHALRIETKKLRYTLEFFHEVLGKEAKGVIAELKIIQDHLGDLNDANVACQLLSEFIDVSEAQQIGLPLNERQNLEPVVAYLAAKHAERHRLVVTLPKIWKHFNRQENLRNFALSISGL